MGPLGALRGPLETDFGPLDGLGPSRAIPGPLLGLPFRGGPGRLSGPLLAALGCSWASLGPPWGAPGGPRRSWRLPGGSWGPLGGSKVAFCRKAEFRRQYNVFHGFWRVREASWRLLGLSWSPRGGPWGPPGGSWAALSALGWLLGGSWQGPVGPGCFLGGPGLVPGPGRVAARPNPPGPRTCSLYRYVYMFFQI